MMEFEEAPLGTAATAATHERAAAVIAEPNGALDVGRNTSRIWSNRFAFALAVGQGELPLG